MTLRRVHLAASRQPPNDPEGRDRDGCVVEAAFVAVPDVDALGLIEQEWLEGRDLIRAGRWEALRKASAGRWFAQRCVTEDPRAV